MAGIEPIEAAMQETVKLSERLSATVIRGPESWQFFAFVFAATVTLALALLDEIPARPWRIAAKGVAFFGLGYLVLINVRVRGWLSTVLVRFKQERR